MILGVCADKGSPGATTLAAALAMVWPGDRVLLEADPSGGDLAFWARTPAGDLLASEPSVLSLAAAARIGPPPGGLAAFAQRTGWGVDVVAGAPGAHAHTPMRGLWTGVADQAADYPGTAVTDLGRVGLDGPVLPLVRAATGVLLVTRVSVEALYRARERVADLKQVTGAPLLGAGPVAVVVVAARRDAKDAIAQMGALLTASGTAVSIAGVFAYDERSAAELRTGTVSKRLRDGDLLASATDLADAATALWPQLSARPDTSPGPGRATPGPGAGPSPASPLQVDVRDPRPPVAQLGGHDAPSAPELSGWTRPSGRRP